MKFAALIATAAAVKTSDLPKMSMAKKFKRPQLTFAQMKMAVATEYMADPYLMEFFDWLD